jgi:hypothetical protein
LREARLRPLQSTSKKEIDLLEEGDSWVLVDYKPTVSTQAQEVEITFAKILCADSNI